jgi:hypothetical protein
MISASCIYLFTSTINPKAAFKSLDAGPVDSFICSFCINDSFVSNSTVVFAPHDEQNAASSGNSAPQLVQF